MGLDSCYRTDWMNWTLAWADWAMKILLAMPVRHHYVIMSSATDVVDPTFVMADSTELPTYRKMLGVLRRIHVLFVPSEAGSRG